MRLPSYSELDRDQVGVFTDTPDDGCLLITGPPGTGKTVVALHRASRLSQGGKENVTILMFSGVLSNYTGSGSDDVLNKSIEVSTLNKWSARWYRAAFGEEAPMKSIKYKELDWPKVRENILKCHDPNILNKLNWSHLIIDEGQDFTPDMYDTFHVLFKHKDFDFNSTLTVFADDNQSIMKDNSTIDEIIAALNVTVQNKRLWRLDKNYRNCREVARVAKFFQLSHAGSAQIPEQESGQVPKAMFRDKPGSIVQQIVNYAGSNGSIEIGVFIVGQAKKVTSAYNSLKSQLSKVDFSIHLQGYSSYPKIKEFDRPTKLKFDAPPSVTVLNAKSVKGLEFDTVFVLNLHAAGSMDSGRALGLYKDLYVISSRARSELYFMIKTQDGVVPENITLLPPPHLEDKLLEYVDLDGNGKIQAELGRFEWDSELIPRHSLRRDAKVLAKKVSKLEPEEVRELIAPFVLHLKDMQILSLVEPRMKSGNISDIADLLLEVGVSKVQKKLNSMEGVSN